MRFLVTGFGPFGSERDNPTQGLVDALPEDLVFPPREEGGERHPIVTAMLPVTVAGVRERLPRLLAEHRPQVYVGLGLAAGRPALAIERFGLNILDFPMPDNDGFQPAEVPIVADGAEAYRSTLPLKAVVSAWREAGIAGYVSNTAGTYVCNLALYTALHWASVHDPGMRAGFMHVPYATESVPNPRKDPSLPFTALRHGVLVALETAVTLTQH